MGIEEYLDHCYEKYFRDLIEEFRMTGLEKEVYDLGGLYQAAAQNLVVRLVNDRGLVTFEIASAHRPADFRYVELIAELFRTPGDQRPGILRLDLSEQTDLLQTHWNRLNELFGPENLENTYAQLLQLGRQRARLMFGKETL